MADNVSGRRPAPSFELDLALVREWCAERMAGDSALQVAHQDRVWRVIEELSRRAQRPARPVRLPRPGTPAARFSLGDRVKWSGEARKTLRVGGDLNATVCGFSRDDECVRIRRDGTNGQRSYHASFLETANATSSVYSADSANNTTTVESAGGSPLSKGL